ncbi:ABC transporter ATP-binding protein, partial [Streptomyces sp. DSM 41529]|nr:ABC transporter ATP-binding protein [Streptomyces sp. DSM 41529]
MRPGHRVRAQPAAGGVPLTATTTTTGPEPSASPGLSKPVGDPPLLEVRNLTVTYGGTVPAVRGVDLRVEAGQKLGIAGE